MPQRARVFDKSGSHRGLIEGSTVRLPSKRAEVGWWSCRGRIRRLPFQCVMREMVVEVGPEIEQLVFEVCRRPEQPVLQVFAPQRADQPFHEWMGQGNEGDGLDLCHLQYPQLGAKQRRRLQYDCRTEQPGWTHQERHQAGEDAVRGA